MRDSSMPLSAREIYQGCRTPSINSKFSESPGTPDLGHSSSARDFYQGFHSPSDWSQLPQTSTDTEDDDGDHDQPSLTETGNEFDKVFQLSSKNSAVQRRRYSRADIKKITGHFRRQRRPYSRADIEKITGHFGRLISHGETFEKVYYGNLADGATVAVKVLSSELWHSSASFNQFKRMIEKFVGLEHKNLLRIMGYYFGKSFSALIMEYTPRRNLDMVYFFLSKPLAPKETEENFIRFLKLSASAGSLDPKFLTWVQRIQIALGVAQGLEYLHNGCMYHGNVKLANILLDENLNAKLAEPRCVIFSHLGTESDVYDFGNVLWFLITGLPSSLEISYPTADDMDRWWELPTLILDTVAPSLCFDSVNCGVPDALVDTTLKFSDSLEWRLTGKSALTFQPSIRDELPRGLIDSVCLGIKIAGACTFTTTVARPAMNLVVHALKVCLNQANQEAPSLAEGGSRGSTYF